MEVNKVKFPKRRSDGSFSIIVRYSILVGESASLIEIINQWFVEWYRINQEWTWFENTEHETQYLLNDEFTCPPYALKIDERHLGIVLNGKPTSKKFWKDWLVIRILPELKQAFPQIEEVIGIKNYDQIA